MKTINLHNAHPNFDLYSDEELCKLYQLHGDQRIIIELLNRYDRYLISLTLPFLRYIDTVGDFKMDLYILLHKLLKTSKPKVFKHWLGAVARRKMYDRVKKCRPEIMEDLPERKLEVARNWNFHLDFSKVMEAIENLKPEQRLYIEMAFFLGYKQREIQAELNWPQDKPRKVRQNAIRNLRKALGGFAQYLESA